jgi:hypothetical protein
MKDALLKAARADSIPDGESGLWTVKKVVLAQNLLTRRQGKLVELAAGTYTKLLAGTSGSLMQGGEVVMEDTPYELRTHLDFMLRARGRVLITGLGLGCVVRGCLANPNVEHVVCIERSKDVLKLVGPHMPKKRLTIILADALKWVPQHAGDQFDCAWHDLWTNEDQGEPHLQVWHSHLLASLAGQVAFQGAWAFPRSQRRAWNALTPVI